MVAKRFQAEPVKGLHLDPFTGQMLHQRADPMLHLPSGLAGEGECEDSVRGCGAVSDQVGDTVGEGHGFSRARSRRNKQRPPAVNHRRSLLGVERVQNGIGNLRRGQGRVRGSFRAGSDHRTHRAGQGADRLGRGLEKPHLTGDRRPFRSVKKPYDPVVPVVAFLAQNLSASHPPYGLGQRRTSRGLDLLGGRVEEDVKLRAQLPKESFVDGLDLPGGGAA